MNSNDHSLRDRLLSESPKPDDLTTYRQAVLSLIGSNEKRLRRERILVTAFWIFCAISATVWLWFSAESGGMPRGPFLACIFFTWGGVELVKHYVNAARVDVLKEIKQVQVQMFALQAGMQERSAAE